MNCPKCQQYMIGVQYAWDHPEHYDGVSEWMCIACELRIGRWSGRELGQNEVEPRCGRRDHFVDANKMVEEKAK